MPYYICYNATKNEKDHIGRKFGIRHLEHDAEAAEGWTKWRIPSYEYIYAACESDDTFAKVMAYMQENGIPLAGAVHDFTSSQTGKSYMYFPIRKLVFAPPYGALNNLALHYAEKHPLHVIEAWYEEYQSEK